MQMHPQDIEMMLSILEKTRNLPKLAPIHNAAMKVLEQHAQYITDRDTPKPVEAPDSDPIYPKPTEDPPDWKEKVNARRA